MTDALPKNHIVLDQNAPEAKAEQKIQLRPGEEMTTHTLEGYGSESEPARVTIVSGSNGEPPTIPDGTTCVGIIACFHDPDAPGHVFMTVDGKRVQGAPIPLEHERIIVRWYATHHAHMVLHDAQRIAMTNKVVAHAQAVAADIRKSCPCESCLAWRDHEAKRAREAS